MLLFCQSTFVCGRCCIISISLSEEFHPLVIEWIFACATIVGMICDVLQKGTKLAGKCLTKLNWVHCAGRMSVHRIVLVRVLTTCVNTGFCLGRTEFIQ